MKTYLKYTRHTLKRRTVNTVNPFLRGGVQERLRSTEHSASAGNGLPAFPLSSSSGKSPDVPSAPCMAPIPSL